MTRRYALRDDQWERIKDLLLPLSLCRLVRSVLFTAMFKVASFKFWSPINIEVEAGFAVNMRGAPVY